MSSIINKTYAINIPANESLLLPSGGTYVYCTDANLTGFRVAIDDVAEGKCGPGLGYKLDRDEEPFSRVRIVNNNGAGLVATIVIGTGRVLDNRLTLTGVVQIEGAAAPAFAVQTQQFWGDGFASLNWNEGATAGQLSHALYYNTAASGVVVEFTLIDVTSASAGFTLRRAAATIGTERLFQPSALRLGDLFATSVELWTFRNAVAQGNQLYALPLTGGQLRHKPDTHILVPPGEALVIAADTVNQLINVKVQFREWPI